jgi:hypothetical protein
VQHVEVVWSENVADYFQVGDPAERIARLAREVKQRQEAGDAKGARQALRRLHAAAFDWEDALADAGPGLNLDGRPARVTRTAPVQTRTVPVETRGAGPGNVAGASTSAVQTRTVPVETRVAPVAENQAKTVAPEAQPGGAGRNNKPLPGGGTDVEARLRDLEQKVDRLLKALEERPLPERK